MSITVKIKKTDPRAIIPKYQTVGASGLDLHAVLDHDLFLSPGDRYLIDVGLAFEIPEGWEGQVRPRSGLSKNNGVLCSFGTIDHDYRGSIAVCLYNHSFSAFRVKSGDRVAQIVFKPAPQVTLQLVDNLSDTVRGTKGFGHSGV